MNNSKRIGRFPIRHFYKEDISENIESARFKIGVYRLIFGKK